MPKQTITTLVLLLAIFFPLSLMAKQNNLQTTNVISIKHYSNVQWLEHQIIVAEISAKDDVVTSATERLLAIDANNNDALSALGRLYFRQGKKQQAQIMLRRLRNDKGAQQAYLDLQQYLALQSEQKSQYNRARLLIKGGQTQQAIEAYNKLFSGRFSTLTYRLEYLNLLAYRSENWQAIDTELSEYVALYPSVPVLDFEYANHLRRRDPQDEQAMAIFSRLANDPKLGLQASDLWLRSLAEYPMSEKWLADYASIAAFHPRTLAYQEAYQRAKSGWSTEKKLRKDPSYLAKLDGIRMIDNNQSGLKTLRKLNYANSTRPNDSEINSALGQYWLRNKNYSKSIQYFNKAQRLDKNPNHQAFYNASIETANYWQQIKLADNAIVNNKMKTAKKHYYNAIDITPEQAYAYIKLAKLSQAQTQTKDAERYLQQALTKAPFSEYALETGINIRLNNDGVAVALAYTHTLSAKQQKIVARQIEQLQQALLIQQLQIALTENRHNDVKRLVKLLVNGKNNDPWSTKTIAYEMQSIGLTEQADQLMSGAYQHNKTTQMKYAYALYLSAFHSAESAKAITATIPSSQRDESINSLDKRLNNHIANQKLTRIAALDLKQAELYLQQKIKDPANTLFVVNGYIQIGHNNVAQKIFTESDLTLIDNEDWPEHIRLAGEFKDSNRLVLIEQNIQKNAKITQKSSLLYQIKIAKQRISAYELLNKGYIEQARLVYFKLVNSNESVEIDALLLLAEHAAKNNRTHWEYRYLMQQSNNMNDAQLLRAFALTQDLQHNQDAIQILTAIDREDTDSYYFWLTHDIAEQYGNNTVTQAFAFKTLQRDAFVTQHKSLSKKDSYVQARDFWMTNNARASIDVEYNKQQSYLEVGVNSSFETSDSRNTSIPLSAKIAIPEWEGHLLLRNEIVTSNNDNYSALGFNGSATGISFAIGWETKALRADIGTTPINFEYQQWVGGFRYNIEISDFSFKIDLSQRPETGSSIAYAGISDNIDNKWGGVLKTGTSLGMSWDTGKPVGFWSVAEFHQLTGNNVEDNQRIALMAGSYYKLKTQYNQRLNIGLNLFSMGYDNNQNKIASGYGDYYSPQSYFSISVPVSYYTRPSQNWSAGVLGSISHSWSKIEAPLNTTGKTQYSSGLGASFEAVTEYKLSSHWSIGGYLGIQVSSDYQPNQVKLYLRYYFNENWRTIDLIPSPVELYSDF